MLAVSVAVTALVSWRVCRRGRDEAAEALERERASTEALTAVIQASPLATQSIDREGRVTMWNPAAEAVFGWTAEEVLGRPLPIVPEGFEEEHRELREIVAGGCGFTGVEVRRRRKDGALVDVSVSTAPLRNGSGAVVGAVGVYLDVTEQRRGDAERAALEERLRRSERLEAVGRLAGGVAHDFNNLLTAIIGYTDFALVAASGNTRAEKHLHAVGEAAQRAAGLTGQILAFGRTRSPHPQLLDLAELVRGMSGLLRRLAGEDVELVTTLSRESGAVRADSTQLEQVLLNLVVNARDAMPTGGRVTVTTENVDVDAREAARHGNAVVPGPHVRLTVADTGVGMTDEVRRQVFEPFFTTKEAGHGTGLGLASVYAVVAEHDGSIRVDSRPGEGARFELLLPRVADVARQDEPSCPGTAAGGAESILLVEDDRWVRILLADLLSAQGYDVVEASGGLEALRIASEHGTPFALLVTDAVMPGMNGLELAERARQEGIVDRVLFVSGYETSALAQRGIGAGFSVLHKPFTPEELAREVRAALDGADPLAGSPRSETLGA